MTASPRTDHSLRRRAVATYFLTAALSSTAYIAAFTVAALAAPELSGTDATSGWPNAIAIAGTAAAATLLSMIMVRRGRRFGIIVGVAIGLAGGVGSLLSVVVGSLPLLLVAAVAIGFANAAIQLSRYAAADLFPPDERAGAIGTVVWGSTVGAVLGPNLIAPAADLGAGLGLEPLAAAFAVPVVFLVLAVAVAALGPRPPTAATPAEEPAAGVVAHVPVRTLLLRLLSQPTTRAAIVTLICAQLVMVLIMTMTPIHLRGGGHDLGTIGLVISSHTFGMFALSPLSGRAADRFGAPSMIVVGFAVLAAAGLLAAGDPSSGGLMAFPLFLLGVGWNLCFVAGSSLLASGASYAERARAQGGVDSTVWTAGALASVSSGVILDAAGFTILALIGGGLAILLALVMLARRPALRTTVHAADAP